MIEQILSGIVLAMGFAIGVSVAKIINHLVERKGKIDCKCTIVNGEWITGNGTSDCCKEQKEKFDQLK